MFLQRCSNREISEKRATLLQISRDRVDICSQKAWKMLAEKRISKNNLLQAKSFDIVDENPKSVFAKHIATDVLNEHFFRTNTICKTRVSDRSANNEKKRKKSLNCMIKTKAQKQTSESGACLDQGVDQSKSGKVVSADSVLVCKICNKKFCSGKSHRIHIRVHSGEKSYTCHICGKQFVQGGSLYYHLKHVHDGVKNHTCDICGRSFAMKTAMEDHRRIHTGERPYVCHTCGKTFKTKASIYIHNKTHTDEFPHNCTYCAKRFRWRQQMLVHLTVHTGEKNHTCDVCGRGFGVKNDLTRHKRIHSKEKPFTCQRCGISFSQKRYLKNHERLRLGICEHTKSSSRVE